jgi:Tfp pilus assembly protein PilF
VALRLDPESADSHAIAGLVSLRTGAGKESVLRYREALRLHPSDEHGKQAP